MGSVYRLTSGDLDLFNEKIESVLSVISRKQKNIVFSQEIITLTYSVVKLMLKLISF